MDKAAKDEGPWPPREADVDPESTLSAAARLLGKLLTVPKAEADEVHRNHHQD